MKRVNVRESRAVGVSILVVAVEPWALNPASLQPHPNLVLLSTGSTRCSKSLNLVVPQPVPQPSRSSIVAKLKGHQSDEDEDAVQGFYVGFSIPRSYSYVCLFVCLGSLGSPGTQYPKLCPNSEC